MASVVGVVVTTAVDTLPQSVLIANTPIGTCGTGGGGGTACTVAADCPGSDTACQARSCTNGVCSVINVPSGMAIANQIAGDCRINVCDGNGGVSSVADNTDVPPNGGNQCTTSTCNNGVASTASAPQGTACSQSGGVVCDGAGACVQCVSGAQCFTPNGTPACTAGMCGILACNSGFADCDRNPANGCETNIQSSADNCGACGRACGAGQFCIAGQCAGGGLDDATAPVLFSSVPR